MIGRVLPLTKRVSAGLPVPLRVTGVLPLTVPLRVTGPRPLVRDRRAIPGRTLRGGGRGESTGETGPGSRPPARPTGLCGDRPRSAAAADVGPGADSARS